MNAQELDFAYKVRHALNEKIDLLPENVTEKLASSRKIALSRKKAHSPLRAFVRQNALAGYVGDFFSHPSTYWLSRLATLATLAILVTGLMGIYQSEEQHQIKETAIMDVAVLSDELPPNAYLDPGFKNFLNKRGS